MSKSKKTILLSVFPEYVEKIISGEKRFEFRKHTPSENVSFIVFYATAPVAKILCIAEVDEIICDSPSRLWRTTALFSGVDKNFYDEYYRGIDNAYAYKLGRVYQLNSPVSLVDENLRLSPPQTFRYLTPGQFSYLRKDSRLVSSSFRRTIFLGGIHAVGKTTFATKYFSKKFQCVSASSLIKDAKGEVPKDKKVGHVTENQWLLVSEFKKLKSRGHRIVLDGHFCLINKDGKFEKLPLELFRALELSHIVLLELNPETIQKRLLLRDGSKMHLRTIKTFLKKEREHALFIAENLKIPITIIPDTTLADNIILDR